jgi:hypothetical protein
MRRLLLHLSTSVVAFALGLATAMIFGVFSFTSTGGRFSPSVHVEPPAAPRACPNAPKFSHELPPLPPLPPAPPAAPLPPEPPLKGTHVVIRRADGTVEVIETEKRVEQKRKGS